MAARIILVFLNIPIFGLLDAASAILAPATPKKINNDLVAKIKHIFHIYKFFYTKKLIVTSVKETHPLPDLYIRRVVFFIRR